MLKTKNLLIVGVILVVLVGISLLQTSRHRDATNRASTEELIAGDIARGDLARIVVSVAGDDAVTLSSGPEHWRVDSAFGVQANNQRIDTLLLSLSNLRGDFRSESADILGDYGFTDSSTVTLTGIASGGDEVFAIQIGNKAAAGPGNFVKLPGSDRVYLTGQGILGNLGLWGGPGRPESRHFLELQAQRLDKNDVESIAIAGESRLLLTKEYAMIEPAEGDTVQTEPYADRETWEWRLGDGMLAVKTKADAVLNAVTNLRAQDVADPDPSRLAGYGLDPAERTVTLSLAGGDVVDISIGLEREVEGDAPKGHYMRIGDDPTVWVLGSYNVTNIFKERADLLPE